MKTTLSFIVLAISVIAFALPANADPYCRPCPFDCTDLGLGRKDCSELAGNRGACCVDLTSKGLRLAQEQDRVNQQQGGGHSNQGNRGQDRCPAGFSPSEQKCSPEERRRGCKDIRTPSGLGCVSRR